MAGENSSRKVFPFLRKVLFRIDFQFIPEQKQEEIYTYIAEKYNDKFSDRGLEQANSVDIEINTNSPEGSIVNTKPQTVYYLVKPKSDVDDGRTIKIGKTFIFLDIDLSIESEYVPYYDWVADIVNYLTEMKLFTPTRVGLRKFNAFFMLDKNIDKMDELFSFDFFEKVDEPSFVLDQFNNIQQYNSENYSLNFSRGATTGFLNNDIIKNEKAHQITFDFDLYSNHSDVLSDFCVNSKENLEQMNNMIRNFFKKLLCEGIYEKIESNDLLEDYCVIPF